MAGNFFRGTSVEQDGRWGKSDQKLMESMTKAGKFAAILDSKVNLKKVNLDVISKWVHEKIIELLGFEDDILINLVNNMLQGGELEGKKLQLDVTGFLGKQTGAFVEELWAFLVDAQNQPNGIPSAFIQKKKQEIINRQQNLVQKILENDTGGSWGSAAPGGKVVDSDAPKLDTKSDDKGGVVDDRKKENFRRESSRSPERYRRDSRGNGTSGRPDREDRYGSRREESRPHRDDYSRNRERDSYRDSRYRDDYDRDRNRGRDGGRDDGGGYSHRRRDSRSRSAERNNKRRDLDSNGNGDLGDRKKRTRSRSETPDRDRNSKSDDHERLSSSKKHRDRDRDEERDREKDKDRKEKKSKKHKHEKDKDRDRDRDRKKDKKSSSSPPHRPRSSSPVDKQDNENEKPSDSHSKDDQVARERSSSSEN
eukprot:gene31019-40354_t